MNDEAILELRIVSERPLVDQARANLGRKLKEVSGDTGLATEANLAALAERKIKAYLPLDAAGTARTMPPASAP